MVHTQKSVCSQKVVIGSSPTLSVVLVMTPVRRRAGRARGLIAVDTDEQDAVAIINAGDARAQKNSEDDAGGGGEEEGR